MSTQKYKVLFRHLSSTIFVSLTILLLLGGMIYMGLKVLQSHSNAALLKTEVTDLSTKAENSITNNNIAPDEVDQFTTLLAQLIPENEDFFSILKSIENLSTQTGFIIVKYSIDPSKSVDQKLSLQVEGVGDPSSFLSFIRDYAFSGGRFITSDSVTFDSTDVGSSTIDLTFYSHKTSSLSKVDKKLSKEDLQLLRTIQSKTVIIVKDTTPSSDSYTTKSNPF